MFQTKRKKSKKKSNKAGIVARQNRPRRPYRILPLGIAGGAIVFLLTIFHYGFSHIIDNTFSRPYRIVPEYERRLEKIVVSLGTKDKNLDLHADLLQHLPGYTEIILLLPENSIQSIMEIIKNQPYFQRTKLIGFNSSRFNSGHAYLIFPERDKLVDTGLIEKIPRGSFWAQDLFKVATKQDGQILLLISDVHKWFISDKDSPLKVVSDNFFLGSLSKAGMEIKRLPFTFKGGNILIDEFKNRKVAICGGDMFRLTRTVWKSSRDSVPTDAQIVKMVKKAFNVDEVLVVGKERVQPSLMFHLDQAMVFLSNGVVAITNIVGKTNHNSSITQEVKAVEVFLSELKAKLTGLGYKLVNIDTSTHNVLNYQFYVNGIPYADSVTGQKTFLMPIYPSSQTEYEKELIGKNTEILERLGYSVIHVPSNANKFYGGIHCLANVIE